jgi:hypothetical protein
MSYDAINLAEDVEQILADLDYTFITDDSGETINWLFAGESGLTLSGVDEFESGSHAVACAFRHYVNSTR